MRAVELLLILLSLVALPAAGGGPFESISVTVSTDKTYYRFGEPIEITASECNLTAEPVTVHYWSSCSHDWIRVLDSNEAQVFHCPLIPGCLPAGWDNTWQPGECQNHTYVWNQATDYYCGPGPQVPAGTYTSEHAWLHYEGDRFTLSEPFVIGGITAVPTTSRLGLAGLATLLTLAGLLALNRIRRRREETRGEARSQPSNQAARAGGTLRFAPGPPLSHNRSTN